MNAWQRILAYSLAALFWLAGMAAKHRWPDLDMSAYLTACAGVVGAMGYQHTKQVQL